MASLLGGIGYGEGHGSCFLLPPAGDWVHFCGFNLATVSGCLACQGQCREPWQMSVCDLAGETFYGKSIRPKQCTQRWKCGYHRLQAQAMLAKVCTFSTSRLGIWTWITLMWLLSRAVSGDPAHAVLALCLTAMSCPCALPWKKICLVIHAGKCPIAALPQHKLQVIDVNWLKFHQIWNFSSQVLGWPLPNTLPKHLLLSTIPSLPEHLVPEAMLSAVLPKAHTVYGCVLTSPLPPLPDICKSLLSSFLTHFPFSSWNSRVRGFWTLAELMGYFHNTPHFRN